MVLLLTGLSVNILGPVGPALMHQLSSSTTSVGAIFSAEGLGNFIGSAVAGSVLQRHSAHRVISCACAVIFVGVGAVPSCSALSHVMLLYLLVGAAAGIVNAAANTMVCWVWRGSSGRLGAVLNLVNACFPLGGSTAPLLVLLSEHRLGNPLVAFLGIGIWWLMTLAYGRARAQTLAPFEYTGLIWSALLGYALFQEVPGWRVYAGAAIIIAACLVVAFETHFISRREARIPASDILT